MSDLSADDLRARVLAVLDERITDCQAATEGLWFVVGLPWNDGEPYVVAGDEDPHIGTFVADITSDGRAEPNSAAQDADARHIAAHDPTTMLALYEFLRLLADGERPGTLATGPRLHALAAALGVSP